jgi:hypothetical protein
MHLRIPLTGFVFGGAWSRDQGGIDDNDLLHGHSTLLELRFERLKHLLAEVVLLKQMPERQDRLLNWNSIADQCDPCKVAHGVHLD